MAMGFDDFAALLANVLRLDRPVSGDDNFIELGGDSLAAAVVAGQVEDAIGAEAPIRAFFEEQDLNGVWQRIAAAAADRGQPA